MREWGTQLGVVATGNSNSGLSSCERASSAGLIYAARARKGVSLVAHTTREIRISRCTYTTDDPPNMSTVDGSPHPTAHNPEPTGDGRYESNLEEYEREDGRPPYILTLPEVKLLSIAGVRISSDPARTTIF